MTEVEVSPMEAPALVLRKQLSDAVLSGDRLAVLRAQARLVTHELTSGAMTHQGELSAHRVLAMIHREIEEQVGREFVGAEAPGAVPPPVDEDEVAREAAAAAAVTRLMDVRGRREQRRAMGTVSS